MSKKIKTNRAITAFVRNLHTTAKKQDSKKSMRTAKKILAVAEATPEKDWTPNMVESVNKAAEFLRSLTTAIKKDTAAFKKERTVKTEKTTAKKTAAKKTDDVIVVSDMVPLSVTVGNDTIVRIRSHYKVAGTVLDRVIDAVRRDIVRMLKEFGGRVESGKHHATAYYTVKIAGTAVKRIEVSPRALDYVTARIKDAVKAELSAIKREFRAAKLEAEKKTAAEAPVARKRNAPARPSRQLKSKPFGKSTKKTAK